MQKIKQFLQRGISPIWAIVVAVSLAAVFLLLGMSYELTYYILIIAAVGLLYLQIKIVMRFRKMRFTMKLASTPIFISNFYFLYIIYNLFFRGGDAMGRGLTFILGPFLWLGLTIIFLIFGFVFGKIIEFLAPKIRVSKEFLAILAYFLLGISLVLIAVFR